MELIKALNPTQNLDLLYYSTVKMIIQGHSLTKENPHSPLKISIGFGGLISNSEKTQKNIKYV